LREAAHPYGATTTAGIRTQRLPNVARPLEVNPHAMATNVLSLLTRSILFFVY